MMSFIALACGFAAGNFLYQATGDHNWGLAIDRSWFQATAIFAVWCLQRVSVRVGSTK